MPLRDICNKSVICVTQDTSVHEAARLMRDRHVGDLVVTDDAAGGPVPVGIVTDRDLVTMVLACDISPTELTVSDVMMKNPKVAREGDGVFEVTRRMKTAGIRRMPVVDDQGFLVGMVAVDDLYQMLATEFNNLAQVPHRQINRERQEDYYSSRF
jgi:CBS domain-containing protein